MAARSPICILIWKDGLIHVPARVDRLALEALPNGQVMELYSYKPPTSKQERYLRALWRLGAETHRDDAAFRTEGAIKNECKRIAGVFDGYIVRDGAETRMNFLRTTDLDAEKIKALIDVTIAFLIDEVLPLGTDIDALRQEVKDRSTRRKS